MKCVVYSRKLSVVDKEPPVTIREQNDRLRDFAKLHSLKIAAFYEDKSDDPGADRGFVKLKEDGIAGKFNLVLLESICRCGKSVSEARFLLLETFFVAGIHFIITDDNIDSRNSDYKSLKEYFRARAIRASKLNTIERKKKDILNGKDIPAEMAFYGYRLPEDRKNIVADEYAAGIVRRVFTMLSSGMRPGKISKVLNDEKTECPGKYLQRAYKNKNDSITGHWSSKNIIRIRDNVKYTGTPVETGFGIFSYPQIIEQDVFDRVRVNKTKRKKPKNQYDSSFNPFTNLVYYKENGEKMIMRTGDDKKDERFFMTGKHTLKVIGFRKLYSEVMKVIDTEKKESLSVLEMLDKDIYDIREKVNEEYRDRARMIFENCRMSACEKIKREIDYEKGIVSEALYRKENDSIQEMINRYNDEFSSLITERDRRFRKINKNNRWLRLYCSVDTKSPMDRKTAVNLIEKIIVDSNHLVEVSLKTPDKEVFPK